MSELAIDIGVLNRMAWRARSRPWRRLFSLNLRDQHEEIKRLTACLLERGCKREVAMHYVVMASLQHELQAFHDYVSEHADYGTARSEVNGLDVVLVDNGYRWLSRSDAAHLKALIMLDAEQVCAPVAMEEQRRAWHDEATSMWESTAGDLVSALQEPLPQALGEAALEYDGDCEPMADLQLDELFRWAIGDPYRLLALERCWTQDRLSTPSERRAALAAAPADLLAEMDAFWSTDLGWAQQMAAWLARGLVRAERLRRCRYVDWSPEYPVSPWWRSQSPTETLQAKVSDWLARDVPEEVVECRDPIVFGGS